MYLYTVDALGNASLLSNVEAAATNTTLMLFDDEGTVITEMPSEDKGINFAVQLSPGASSYAALATDTPTTSGDIPPSGAGCNGGFGALTGVLAMAFTGSAVLIRRKEN